MSEFQASPDAGGATTEAIDPAAAQPNAATTQAQTDGADGGEGSPAAPKTFTQKELDDIVQRRIAKAEAKAERRVLGMVERLLPQQQQAAPTKQPADEGKPLRSQFASEDQWLDARDAWRDNQRESQKSRSQQEQSEQVMVEKTRGVFAKAEKLGFDAEAFADLPCPGAMTDAILESEAPEKLLVHLQQNPDEARRIAALSPARQAAEIGKLETKVAEHKPPARSNAPPALGGAKGQPTTGAPDPSNTKAYVKWANEQERAAR